MATKRAKLQQRIKDIKILLDEKRLQLNKLNDQQQSLIKKYECKSKVSVDSGIDLDTSSSLNATASVYVPANYNHYGRDQVARVMSNGGLTQFYLDLNSTKNDAMNRTIDDLTLSTIYTDASFNRSMAVNSNYLDDDSGISLDRSHIAHISKIQVVDYLNDDFLLTRF